METGLLERKTALRSAARARLAALTPTARAEHSKRLVSQLTRLPVWREALRVLLFAPLPVEPDLDLLWRDGALEHKQCAYPRVEGVAMRLYYVNRLDELEPTRWGLREPSPRAAREAELDDIDVVLVPGLAFDEAGGRLGRGGGFYDRLLAGRNPAKTRLVGVGFSFQVLDESLPLAPHDVRLDEICTD